MDEIISLNSNLDSSVFAEVSAGQAKLRKERIISDRDEFGKILLSKIPKRRLFR